MAKNERITLDRRKILVAAMLGGGTVAISGCSNLDEEKVDDLWSGFDGRITERTLAEAEKLFGVSFSETERRQILGGAAELFSHQQRRSSVPRGTVAAGT